MDSYDFAELYRDGAFARRLAAGLVGESASEDVWHDAWQALLQQPPHTSANLAAYLRTIVRRLALRHRRGEGRRQRREQATAGGASVPSASEIAERMEIHRVVVDALLALEEPYRRTLFLTFFEDLSPAEVAEREGVPLETVRTRVKRAIARLRERLELRHGGDREWLRGLALFALGRSEERARPWPRVSAVAFGAAIVVVGVGSWLVLRTSDDHTVHALAASTPVVPSEVDRAPSADLSAARIPLAVPPPPATIAEPVPSVPRIQGRVLDASGQGIPGAEVTLSLGGIADTQTLEKKRSDEEGRYAFDLPVLSPLETRNHHLELLVLARGMRPATPAFQLFDGLADIEQDVVLEPGLTLEGRVLDGQGAPLDSAVVYVEGSSGSGSAAEEGVTDRDGVYRIGVPAGARIDAVWTRDYRGGAAFLSADGWVEAPDGRVHVPDLELLEHHVVRGIAVYPDGTPARSAEMQLRCVRADERGLFHPLAMGEPGRPDGMSWVKAFSDEQGRFVALGLREGPWVCEAPWAPPTKNDLALSATLRENEEARAVVDAHRVLIEAVDPAGAPLADVRLVWTLLEEAPGGRFRPKGRGAHMVTTVPPRAFKGSPGDVNALTALLPGWAEERVFSFTERPYETLMRFELQKDPPRGAVRVRASVKEGAAQPARWKLILETAAARVVVGSWRSDADGLVQGLPCGQFLAVFTTEDDAGFASFEFPEPIEITAGVPQELVLAPAPGAKLRLAFETEEIPEPVELARTPEEPWIGAAPRQDVVLRRAADAPGAAPFLVLRGAAPGKVWESEQALEVGRYHLLARFEGYEPVDQWISIEAGRHEEVLVPLFPSAGGSR